MEPLTDLFWRLIEVPFVFLLPIFVLVGHPDRLRAQGPRHAARFAA
jgi:hypothetical protein